MPKRKKIGEPLTQESLLPEEGGFPKKKSKRKKIKECDRVFNPISYTGAAKGKGLLFRYDNEKTVLKANGQMTPKRTSVLISSSPIKRKSNKPLLDDKGIEALHSKLKSIETHTPIKEITKFSDSGTPIEVKSLSGKTLYKQSTNKILINFSNKTPDHTNTTSLVVDPSFHGSSPAKKIKAPNTSIKKVMVIINKDTLKKVAIQMKKNQGKRSISQNKILGDSATRYVHAAHLTSYKKHEWSHLIAHRFLCDLAQRLENLVATTDHANTEMMSVEDILYRLISENREVKIEATAYLFVQTHIASRIDYKVHLDDYEFLFSFEPQQTNKPDKTSKLALEAFFSVLFPEKNLKSDSALSHTDQKNKSLLLFSKSKQDQIDLSKNYFLLPNTTNTIPPTKENTPKIGDK